VIGQTLIDTPNGGRVPLSAVTTLRWMGERTELNRERLRPVVHVTSRIEGSDLGNGDCAAGTITSGQGEQ
jgi:hypothetical protein